MKINSKVVNIPPFISTSWENVASLHMKGSTLGFVLSNGDTIYVPGLPPTTVELIFAAHEAYLEEQAQKKERSAPFEGNFIMQAFAGEEGQSPMQLGFTNAEGMGAALKHDPTQKEMPPLPDEVLSKISAIAKIVSSGEEVSFPKAEPGCNCMHCQICRAISGEKAPAEAVEEPLVKDDELLFRDWEIHQTGDKLFEVVNPLDRNEKYNVFLGDPVGCTCGVQGCEHIIAVLKS